MLTQWCLAERTHQIELVVLALLQLKSAKRSGKGFHLELAHNLFEIVSGCGKIFRNIWISQKLQNRRLLRQGYNSMSFIRSQFFGTHTHAYPTLRIPLQIVSSELG